MADEDLQQLEPIESPFAEDSGALPSYRIPKGFRRVIAPRIKLPAGFRVHTPLVPRAPETVTPSPREEQPVEPGSPPLAPSPAPITPQPRLAAQPPETAIPGGLPTGAPAVTSPIPRAPQTVTPPPEPSILDRAAALKEELYHNFNHTFPAQQESVLGRFLSGFVKAPPRPPVPGQKVPMDVFSRVTPPPEYKPPEPEPQLQEEAVGGRYGPVFQAVAGPTTTLGQVRPTLRQAVTPQGFQPFYEQPGQKPFVDFSQFVPEDRPLIKGVADVISGLTVPNPQNAALWSSGPLMKMASGPIGRAVAAGFSIDMLSEMPEQGKAFRKALDEGRLDDAERIVGQMMATGATAGFLGARAQFGGKQLGPMIREARAASAVRRAAMAPEVLPPEPTVTPPVGQRLLRGAGDVTVRPYETPLLQAPPPTVQTGAEELPQVPRPGPGVVPAPVPAGRQEIPAPEGAVGQRPEAPAREAAVTRPGLEPTVAAPTGRVERPLPGIQRPESELGRENLPYPEPRVERPTEERPTTEVRPTPPSPRVEEPSLEDQPSVIWGAPKKRVQEILTGDPAESHEVGRRAEEYLEDWSNLALGQKTTTYIREGGEGRITGRVSELEGGDRHPSEVEGIRQVYETDGYQRVAQALKEQKGSTWNKLKFQAERMALEDLLADKVLTDEDYERIVDRAGAHDEIAIREGIRQAVLEKLSPAPALTEEDLQFQRAIPEGQKAYTMLTPKGTRSFYATDDRAALERFRDEGGRELRQRREGEYPLGRLVAYRDAAGYPHIANIERPSEPLDIQFQRGEKPSRLHPALTEKERSQLSVGQRAEAFNQALQKLPEVRELVAAAKAGSVGRDWYERSIQAFDAMRDLAPAYFRPDDADRFAGVLAATSPQQSVAMNLRETLRFWKEWDDAGRPSSAKQILKLQNRGKISPLTNQGAKLGNVVRAINGLDLTQDEQYRNFKIANFAKNLSSAVEPGVTLDSWMGVFSGLDKNQLEKAHFYHSLAVKTRLAARKLGWHPRQAQAAIWSFVRTLSTLSGWGKGRHHPPTEVLNFLTHEDLARFSQDFSDLLYTDDDVRNKLEELGVDLHELDKRLEQIPKPSLEGAVQKTPSRLLGRAAERISKAQQQLRGFRGYSKYRREVEEPTEEEPEVQFQRKVGKPEGPGLFEPKVERPEPKPETLAEPTKKVGKGFVPGRYQLDKPIQGPTGAKIWGYQWKSEIGDKYSEREGGYVGARISNWDDSEISEGTGREIVHVYYVEHPDGSVTTEGIQSAQKILGIDVPRLKTIAKNAMIAAQHKAEQQRLELESIESSAKDTPAEAARRYRQGNWSPMRSEEENNRIFYASKLLTKEGKFVRAGEPRATMLQEHGWKLAEHDPVKSRGPVEPKVESPMEEFARKAGEAQEAERQKALGELTRKGQGKITRTMGEVKGPLFGTEEPKKQGGLFEEQKVTAKPLRGQEYNLNFPDREYPPPQHEVEYQRSTSQDPGEPDKITIDPGTASALQKAMPEIFANEVYGFHLAPRERLTFASMVRENMPLAAMVPQKIIDQIDHGLSNVTLTPKAAKSATVVVKGMESRTLSDEDKTALHETLHARQLSVVQEGQPGRVVRGKEIYGLVDLNQFLAHPAALEAMTPLLNRGYKMYQLATESMAHIGAGQYESIGLSKEKAADLYIHSVRLAVDKHGLKGYRLLHGLHETIQPEITRAVGRAAERELPPAHVPAGVQRGIGREAEAGAREALGEPREAARPKELEPLYKPPKEPISFNFQLPPEREAYANLARSRIEMPELVELVQAINEGKLPMLKERLGKALGQFVRREGLPGGKVAEIKLRRDIFIGEHLRTARSASGSDKAFQNFQDEVANSTGLDPKELHFAKDYDKKNKEYVFKAYRKDPTLAPRVLAHEIGHLIDWIGDSKDQEVHQIMDRGNILGRIASLHGYLKETLEGYPGGPSPLDPKDRARLRRLAEQLTRKTGEQEVDEEITTKTPFTPDDILKIWKATVGDAAGIDKKLYLYIASLDRAAKKQIIKEALKGVVPGPPTFPDFPQKTVTVKTGKRIKHKETPGTPEEIAKKYRELILDEIKKRQLLERDTVMDELKGVTRYWNPFDDRKDSDYTKYRYSGKELYADAFSVLLNDPGTLNHMAPNFWRGIMNYMERKPSVKESFDYLQARAGGGGGGNIPPRLGRIAEMFDESQDKRDALNRRRKGETKAAINWLMKELIDRNAAALKPISAAEKAGGLLAEAGRKARYDLEEIPYIASEAANYLYQISADILKAMRKEGGIVTNDIGTVGFLRRIVEERQLMGNPLGFTPKTAQDTLDGMKKQMGADKFSKLEDLVKRFRELRERYIIPRIESSSLATPGVIEMMRSNKNYMRFSVSHWLDQQYGPGVSARVFKQVGTLSKIENPFVVTVLQDLAWLRAAKINEAKQSLLDVLELTLDRGLRRAEMRYSTDVGGMVPKEPKNPKEAIFTVINKGKAEFYYAPKDIVDAFQSQPFEATTLTRIWSAMMQPIRAVLVSMNPVWMARNVPRDFFGSVAKLPEVKTPLDVARLAKAYKAAFREAWNEVMKGSRSADIQAMGERRMLVPGRAYGIKEQDFENDLERLAHEFELDTGAEPAAKDARSKMMKLFESLNMLGRVSEISGKIAGYKFLTQAGTRTPEEIGHVVRTRVGTPDIMRRGAAQALTNNTFLFSNVNKEGWRSTYEAFQEDPATYVWKTLGINVLPKLLLWAAGIGIFGETMRRIIAGISEYDKSQYTIAPIGATKDGKSIYLRIPGDYESQFWGTLAWKLAHLEFLGKGGALNATSEQIPWSPTKLNPYFSTAWDIAQYYAYGNNPTDSWRGLPVIRDKAFEAGGWEATKDLGKHVWRQLGGSVIYDPARNELVQVESRGEKALKTFPLNVLGTFAKVSDQGISEQLQAVTTKERQAEASRSLEVTRRIERSINAAGGRPNRGDASELYWQLREEGKLTQGESRKEFEQRYFSRAVRASEDPYVRKFIEARTTQERAELLKKYRETLGDDRYQAVLEQIMQSQAKSPKSLRQAERRSYQEPRVTPP